MSWKKVGGIQHYPENNIIHSNTSSFNVASTALNLGLPGTTTRAESNIKMKEDTHITSSRDSLDDTTIIAYYDFSDTSFPVKNRSTHTAGTPNRLDLEECNTGNNNIVIVQNDELQFSKYIEFPANSNTLKTSSTFQPNLYLHNYNNLHHNEDWYTFSMNCWVYIPDSLENPISTKNGFLLFGLDDMNMTTADHDNKDIRTDKEGLYFYYPSYKSNNAGLYITSDISNIYTNQGANTVKYTSSREIITNNWTMVTITFDGNRGRVYQNGEEIDNFGCHRKIPIVQNVIINGSRSYNFQTNSWVEPSTPSTNSNIDKIKIADFRIYHNALSPFFIKRMYEHDNANFLNKFIYTLRSDANVFGSETVIQNNLQVNGVFESNDDVRMHGFLDVFNNASITGSLGVGIQNAREKLDVMGTARISNDLVVGNNIHLGRVDADTNGIYFAGLESDGVMEGLHISSGGYYNNTYKHGFIEERFYTPEINKYDSELFI